MKRIIAAIGFIFILNPVLKGQDQIPYPVKYFLNSYVDSLNFYFSQEKPDRRFIYEDFFMNLKDTTFWQNRYNNVDKLFDTRLGPFGNYHAFRQHVSKTSDQYSYYLNRINSITLLKNRSNRYFDSYRILLNEDKIFSNTDFFAGSDSIGQVENIIDLISWFNPSSSDYSYEYRINRISEKVAPSKIIPSNFRFSVDMLFPTITDLSDYYTNNTAYGFSLYANWPIWGVRNSVLSFKSGFGQTYFNFNFKELNRDINDNTLLDKDNYPFNLEMKIKGLKQSVSFQSVNIPLHLQNDYYSSNGKISGSLYAGINLHLITNQNINNQKGTITYRGKYKFDFASDSLLFEDLDSYNFKTFNYNEYPSTRINLNSYFLSAEIGGMFSYYLGKRWSASAGVSYQRALNPLFSRNTERLSYDIIQTEGGNTFKPALNSLFALNEESSVNSFRLNFGISYILQKPVLPYGKVGYGKRETSRILKDQLFLAGRSITPSSQQRTLNITVIDSTSTRGLFGKRLNYTFVGPAPKYYESGKLVIGATKENRLNLQVPSSGGGTRLFLEEPYGYNLEIDESYAAESGGQYGEIKVLNGDRIWTSGVEKANLTIHFSQLKPMYFYLINYKYGMDELGRHREKIINQISVDARRLIEQGIAMFIYVASDNPESFVINKIEQIPEMLENIDIKLRNTNDVFANLEGLIEKLSEDKTNIRRDINLVLFTSNEFIDKGKEAVEIFPELLKINTDFLKNTTYLHTYGQQDAFRFNDAYNYLKKVGILNE